MPSPTEFSNVLLFELGFKDEEKVLYISLSLSLSFILSNSFLQKMISYFDCHDVTANFIVVYTITRHLSEGGEEAGV